MPKNEGYPADEGMVRHNVGSATMRHDAKQPKGSKKAKGGGSKTVDGVTFEGKAASAASNGGNYNEVGSTARKFG